MWDILYVSACWPAKKEEWPSLLWRWANRKQGGKITPSLSCGALVVCVALGGKQSQYQAFNDVFFYSLLLARVFGLGWYAKIQKLQCLVKAVTPLFHITTANFNVFYWDIMWRSSIK